MMLCCERCERPVMLLTGTQEKLVDADPWRYTFWCTDCVNALEA